MGAQTAASLGGWFGHHSAAVAAAVQRHRLVSACQAAWRVRSQGRKRGLHIVVHC